MEINEKFKLEILHVSNIMKDKIVYFLSISRLYSIRKILFFFSVWEKTILLIITFNTFDPFFPAMFN